MHTLKAVLALAAITAANVSNATMITVDPAGFELGADLSHAFEGATLSSVLYPGDPNADIGDPLLPLESGAVYAAQCDRCSPLVQGQMLLGNSNSPVADGLTAVWWYSNRLNDYYRDSLPSPGMAWNALRVDFNEQTDFVQLTAGGRPSGDYAQLNIFDINGNRLATCGSIPGNTGWSDGCSATPLGRPDPYSNTDPWVFTFQSSEANIGYITAGGWGGSQYVQSLAFNVPEPSSWALFAFGLGALAFQRRRRRQ